MKLFIQLTILTEPLKLIGKKGRGDFKPISWEQAFHEIVEKFKKVTDEFGAESVWPYYFAGTMGLVQRDGINRLRNVMGYSRQDMTICTSLAWTGWVAGTGSLWGTDPRDIQNSDLIIVWGGNPVALVHPPFFLECLHVLLTTLEFYSEGCGSERSS